MKKHILLVSLLSLTACNFSYHGGKTVKGEGPVLTKNLEFTGFETIEVNGQADITFIQSDTWTVALTTQENIFDVIDYKVEDGRLIIDTKGHATVKAEKYDLSIQAPVLRNVEINGAADLSIPGGLVGDGDLSIQVNGAGDLELDGIACRQLSIEVNGAADVDVKNLRTDFLKILVNGAGDAVLSGEAGEASLQVNGAGDIDARSLRVAGRLDKSTSGVARIRN